MSDMQLDRAREIVGAINSYAYARVGIAEAESVEGLSLADMVQAKLLVETVNREGLVGEHGTRTLLMVPDDRLIAAVYALNHYGASRDAILFRPAVDWDDDRVGRNGVAVLAVVAQPAPLDGDDDDEDD